MRWIHNHVRRLDALSNSSHCVLVYVQGSGLQHATTFQLELPGGQKYKAEVLHTSHLDCLLI